MKGKNPASGGAPPASSANTQANYEEAVALIQREYIDKILNFIRDKGNKGVSPKDFIKVYEVVMFQCDSMDNGAKLYKFFQDVIKNYINDVALPEVKRQNGSSILVAYLKVWDDYAMFSKLMDRMFDYLNRYYLKN